MTVDGMSRELGYTGTYQLLNEYRVSQGMEPVVLSTVYLTVLKLQPKVDRTTWGKQGSADPGAAWLKARLGWTKQLLVLLGELEANENDDNCFKDLPLLTIHRVIFWDEMHKEQIVGHVGGWSYRFPMDMDGKNEPIGAYAQSHQTQPFPWNILAKQDCALE